MGTKVTLEAADGFRLGAYRADPVGPARGGVVVIQEIFGVNHHIRSVCDRLADAGYRTIAPQLFDRVEPNFESGYTVPEVTYARELAGRVDWAKMVVDAFSAVDALKRDGPVAIMGFCMGGSVAFLASTRFGGLAAAICYYGGQIARNADQKPKCPVQMHFGEDDDHISVDDVETIRQKRPECEIHVYHGAGHAFSNEDRSNYELRSAKIAWQRSLALLARVFATAKSKQLTAAATLRHGAEAPELKAEKPEIKKPEAKKIESAAEKPEIKKVTLRKPATKPKIEIKSIAKPEPAKPVVKVPAVKKAEPKKSEPERPAIKKPEIEKPEARKSKVKRKTVKKPRRKKSKKPKSKIAAPAKREITKPKRRKAPVKKLAMRKPKARPQRKAKTQKVMVERAVKVTRKAKARRKVARQPKIETRPRRKIERKRKAMAQRAAKRKKPIRAKPKTRPKPKPMRQPKRRAQKPKRKPAVKRIQPKLAPKPKARPKPRPKPEPKPKPQPQSEPKRRSIWGFGLFSSPNYRRGRF